MVKDDHNIATTWIGDEIPEWIRICIKKEQMKSGNLKNGRINKSSFQHISYSKGIGYISYWYNGDRLCARSYKEEPTLKTTKLNAKIDGNPKIDYEDLMRSAEDKFKNGFFLEALQEYDSILSSFFSSSINEIEDLIIQCVSFNCTLLLKDKEIDVSPLSPVLQKIASKLIFWGFSNLGDEILHLLMKNNHSNNQLDHNVILKNSNGISKKIQKNVANGLNSWKRILNDFMEQIYLKVKLECRVNIFGFNNEDEDDLPPMNMKIMILPGMQGYICYDITKPPEIPSYPEVMLDEGSFFEEINLVPHLIEYIQSYSIVVFQLRTRLSEINPKSKYPLREIWVYRLSLLDEQLQIEEVSASEVYESYTINSIDESHIPPSSEEIYCGGEEEPIFGRDYNDSVSTPFIDDGVDRSTITDDEEQPIIELKEDLQVKRYIKQNFSVHYIICEHCGEKNRCLDCGETDYFRSWNQNGNCVALCYICGLIFCCETGERIKKLKGDRKVWGAQALSLIAVLMDKSEKSKSNTDNGVKMDNQRK